MAAGLPRHDQGVTAQPAPLPALRLCALGVVVALAATGCSGDGQVPGAADARDTWSERGLASYSYTLTSECGERALLGTFAVTVTDGAVSAVEPLDEAAGWSMPAAEPYVPTIEALLDRIADLPAAEVPEATFDDDGVPTRVLFDPVPDAIDDEECFDITDVRPLG